MTTVLLLNIMAQTGQTLSQLVAEQRNISLKRKNRVFDDKSFSSTKFSEQVRTKTSARLRR
jgi:hypothetical protein